MCSVGMRRIGRFAGSLLSLRLSLSYSEIRSCCLCYLRLLVDTVVGKTTECFASGSLFIDWREGLGFFVVGEWLKHSGQVLAC